METSQHINASAAQFNVLAVPARQYVLAVQPVFLSAQEEFASVRRTFTTTNRGLSVSHSVRTVTMVMWQHLRAWAVIIIAPNAMALVQQSASPAWLQTTFLMALCVALAAVIPLTMPTPPTRCVSPVLLRVLHAVPQRQPALRVFLLTIWIV
jgi:hypothetical protein